MPHTSRRPKSKPKKAVYDVGDGWSKIEYSSRPNNNNTSHSAKTPHTLPPVEKGLTVEKIREEHEKIKAKWVDSEYRQRLHEELVKRGPEDSWNVTEAVCIALGSPSMDWHLRMRSVWQFVLFVDVLDMLRSNNKHSETIKVFIQDPRFNNLDIEFFKSMDITVLNDPEAEAHVGDQSFVFSPCLEWESELPYLQAGKETPLYITSKAQWIYDAAEHTKSMKDPACSAERAERCDAAMKAATELLANHHEVRFDNIVHIVDYLPFSYYILKDKEERDEDLASKIKSLDIGNADATST